MKIYVGNKVYELGTNGVLRFCQRVIFHVTPKADGLEIYIASSRFPMSCVPDDVEGDAHEVCAHCGR